MTFILYYFVLEKFMFLLDFCCQSVFARSADVSQTICIFPFGKILVRPAGGREIPVRITVLLIFSGVMKRTDMKPKKSKTYTVKVRVDEEELSKIHGLMDINGYPTVSSFLRDLIFKKKIVTYHRVESVDDEGLRKRINELIYQFNKIGVNYNMVVAQYNKQAKMLRPDGSPYMDTNSIEAKLSRLMSLTENMRDEFALILKLIKEYHQNRTV